VNLLADEDVDGPVVERLRQDGYAVLYVAEMEPGISDEAILRKATGVATLRRPRYETCLSSGFVFAGCHAFSG
jgi:hypothetical protein